MCPLGRLCHPIRPADWALRLPTGTGSQATSTQQFESAARRSWCEYADLVTVRGRYVPSPTTDLHLGNLRTGVVAWLFAHWQESTIGMGSSASLRWHKMGSSASLRWHKMGSSASLRWHNEVQPGKVVSNVKSWS
jgi:hypothetical protein